MRRTAILLGTGLVLAAPLADAGLQFLKGRFAGRAAVAALRQLASENAGFGFRHAVLDPWRGGVRLDDVVLRAPSYALHIAHLTYSPAASPALVAAAHAAAGNVVAENITIDSSDATYKIGRIEATGTDLSEDDLKALFDANSTVPIADRLSRLSAAKIAVPEVSVQLKGEPTNGGVVYHGLELDNVVKGRVAQGTMAGLDATWISEDSGAIEATCGAAKTQDYDIAQNLRLVTETTKNDEAPKPLYASFSVTGCKIKIDKTQSVIDIDAVSVTDVKGRPPRQSWSSAKTLWSADLSQIDDPELRARRRAYLGDIYASYEAKTIAVHGLKINRPQDPNVSGTIATISLNDLAASRIAQIRMDDASFDANGNRLKLARMALRDINMTNIGKLLSRGLEDTSPAPIVDQLVAEGLDVEINDATDPNSHFHFQLAKFDMASAGVSDDIPAHFAVTLDHFTTDLSDLNADRAADITALGYSKLDLSSRLAVAFDRDKQLLGVEDVSVSGRDMGIVKLSGQFSQVSSDLFSSDPAIGEAAVLAALVNRVEIRVENGGLFERIVTAAAKRENKSVDQIRRRYVETVSVTVPAMLDNGPAAKLIGAALAKFVAAPKNFHLVARAANGLGASDFALIKQPGALLEKLDIEATANE